MSAQEFHIYILLILEAAYETGVWHGSAEKLAVVYKIPSRTCRDVLDKLHRKGYIRRFIVRGKRGNYPVLINKYECHDGAGMEVYLNASKSNDWKHPIYDGAATVPGECHDGAGVQEVRTKNKEKSRVQNPHAPPGPRSEQEQRRIVQAQNYREQKEQEARKDAKVGNNWISEQIAELAKGKAM